MGGSGRLLYFSRALRSSLGSNNWYNLGKFATGGSSQQEVHWNNLKGFDSSVTTVVDNNKHESEVLDWSKWDDRISHKNILTHMKKTYTNTMNTLDKALSDSNQPVYLQEGWEDYESVKKTCSDATKTTDKIISDGIKALWISQHNPPTWKVDTNEWLESDQYWQAFVEKHAMYSQSGTSNDPESPSEIEAFKSKWNVNMFKFNERTDTPMLYDYMYHNPSWEYYDIYRKQFFEHLEYFLLRTGEDFRNFPDVPKWKWITHLEDLKFKQFSVEMRRKMNKQLKKVTRFEKTDLGAGEHEQEEEVNMQLLLEEKNNLENVVCRLMGGYGFLVDPLVPVENKFQLNYVLSRDNYNKHRKTKVYSLGSDLPYLFVLPYNSTTSSRSTLSDENSNSEDDKTGDSLSNYNTSNDNSNNNQVVENPMNCFYNLMDYMNMSGYKVNPSYSTRLQLKCQVMYERGPNWLKLPFENSSDGFLRRLRYDDPLRPMFEEYVKELKERLRNAKEVPVEEWDKEFQKLEENLREVNDRLRIEGVDENLKYTKEELKELVDKEQLLVEDNKGKKLNRNLLLKNLNNNHTLEYK